MGNNIRTICGYAQDNSELNYIGKRLPGKYKEKENITKIKTIQNKYREMKSIINLKQNLNSYESNFDLNINTIGKIISEEEYEASIDNHVREIERKLGPLNIDQYHKNKFKYVFTKPPIRFTEEGFIYKGDWNYQGKKHGYGILITKEGNKYIGFWENDQLEGPGRFIEIRGNYYDGIYYSFYLKIFYRILINKIK